MASGTSLPAESAKPSDCGDVLARSLTRRSPGQEAKPEAHANELEDPGSGSNDRILFLDDDPHRARDFLDRHPDAVWVQTAEECIARLAENWDEVHLDHDLGGEIFVDSSREDCGMEVVRCLCSQPEKSHTDTWFFVHSHNAEAADLMVRNLRQHDYKAVYRPFGIDFLAWFESQPVEVPKKPLTPEQPERIRLAPALRGWLHRRWKLFRRSTHSRANHDQVDLAANESSSGSSDFGAE